MHPGTAEQAALAAVAKHCSAGTWQAGDSARSGCLVIDGRRVAAEVAVLAGRRSGPIAATTPRLREDRVAQRVLRDLEAAVSGHARRGRAVIVTLGAPIKVPNRLVAELGALLRDRLRNGAAETDERMDVLGNRVRFRVLRDGSAWTSPVNGFVFSGDPDPGDLAEAMRAMRDLITERAGQHAPRKRAGARWLVLACDAPVADGGTYRRALSRLSVPDAFSRVLLVTAGRRVETLAG